uniref:Uncharacterized protein n=1 Tax=Caldiarchaeum subterraneum TaxID=311458 RepID=E6N5M3_CALS0|nr:hypothetical protein HGMM_F52E01C37 [Candidatus Caldarchaeum subterraneum]
MGMKYERKALELYRRLERLLLPRFEGACIDFHRERPATVFLPHIPTVVQVGNGKLPAFLVSHGVNRVLVDALWPTNVEVLMKLIEDGVEVWVLTRPSALHGWRRKSSGKPRGLVEWLMRHHPDVVKGFKTEIKNDVYDAVLLRYVKPKYHRKMTRVFLMCWPKMVLFRTARKNNQRLLQQLSALPLPEEENTTRLQISENFLTTEANLFVRVLKKEYSEIDKLFTELGIDDVISKAFASEVFLELDETKSLSENRRKFGLIPKKHQDKLIYDGAAKYSLVQLAVKRFGAIPKYLTEEDRKRFSMELGKTLDAIYRWKKTYRRETQKRLAGIPAQQQG